MFKVIRKADIILLCVLLLTAAGSAAFFAVRLSDPAGQVVITLDGQPYGTYDLDSDREVEIRGDDFYNLVRIEGAVVTMASSDCHNQVCVEHAPISHSGESIICLPHKLVVTIKGGKEAEVDAIVQ